MARLIVLLRGINLGAHNRISMPELREALEEAGYDDVRTYLQSGNVVLTSTASAKSVASKCERLIADQFGLEISVVVRTRNELAKVVDQNPLGRVAKDPKRYQVSFLEARPTAKTVRELEDVATANEKVVSIGRELYAWHPDGVARSKLWAQLAGKGLGVTATARNWTTVTKLLELAEAE
jgi:uncharacterized protein (DUF1697 family)